MIKREELVRRYNPVLSSIDTNCPMTIGNGSFAFNADITGLQTFYDEYEKDCPLLTMSEDIWHTAPNSLGGKYTEADLELTGYEYCGRIVKYPVEEKEGNEEVYRWLRENPHRANLFRMILLVDGKPVEKERLTRISQTLDMYTGILQSHFVFDDDSVDVTSVVGNDNTLAVRVESGLCEKRLSVMMEFPYATSQKSASDFEKPEAHETILSNENGKTTVKRVLDDLEFYVGINGNIEVESDSKHVLNIKSKGQDNITFTVFVSKEKDSIRDIQFKQIVDESKFRFYTFWNTGAFIDVSNSEDSRADILEKRIVTSMYQCFVQDLGTMPSQETGLTANSWYGKFHLEMHPIHSAFAALYGRGALLEKSLDWYIKTLPAAKRNAEKNGFKGARWPKMTGPEGIDSPSPIAPLLIWQQPNVLFMLKLLYLSRYKENRVEVPVEAESEFFIKYRELVFETAAFMEDYVEFNHQTGKYELLPPLYSVQEKGNPKEIKNPPFETAFWSFGLRTAYEWMSKLGEKNDNWLKIADNMAEPFIYENKISAYEGYKDTYTSLNLDHPSMLFQYGLFSEKIDEAVLDNSLQAFFTGWDMDSLWGWDFAFLAMTLAKAGRMEEAFDVLLMDTKKNTYLDNGFNAQISRNDLPLYMPGNGSLLLAMTVLKSCKNWYVETEGIMEYPF